MSTNLKNDLNQTQLFEDQTLASQRLVIYYAAKENHYSFVGAILQLIRGVKGPSKNHRNPGQVKLVPPAENSRLHVCGLGRAAASSMFRQEWTTKRRFKSHGFGFIAGRYVLQ